MAHNNPRKDIYVYKMKNKKNISIYIIVMNDDEKTIYYMERYYVIYIYTRIYI